MASDNEPVRIKRARLTLLEHDARDKTKPVDPDLARRAIAAEQEIAKYEGDQAARQKVLDRMYGIQAPTRATPRASSASTPAHASKGLRRLTAGEALAHFRARIGDDWTGQPEPFRRILVGLKRKAGEPLSATEHRMLEGQQVEYFTSKFVVEGGRNG